MARCNRTELLVALRRYLQAIAGLEVWLSWSIGVRWRGCLESVGSCGRGFLG
jgi:hypothetical protein